MSNENTIICILKFPLKKKPIDAAGDQRTSKNTNIGKNVSMIYRTTANGCG